MRFFILIVFVFNFQFVLSQVHPPPYFLISCKDFGINNECLKIFKITTSAFKRFPHSDNSESPDYLVSEFDNGYIYI